MAAKTLCHGSVADPYLGVPPCQPVGFGVLSPCRTWNLSPDEIHDALGLTSFFCSFDPHQRCSIRCLKTAPWACGYWLWGSSRMHFSEPLVDVHQGFWGCHSRRRNHACVTGWHSVLAGTKLGTLLPQGMVSRPYPLIGSKALSQDGGQVSPTCS